MTSSIQKLLNFSSVENPYPEKTYQEVRSQLEKKEILISNIIPLLPGSLFETNSTLRKKIIHLIVKFEHSSESLETHLFALRQYVKPENDSNIIAHYLKRCISEKGSERLKVILSLLKWYNNEDTLVDFFFCI